MLRGVWRRLRNDWKRIPSHVRRSWWRTLGVGLLLVELVVLGSVALTRWLERAGALRWEARTLHWLESRSGLSFTTAMWIEAPTSTGYPPPATPQGVGTRWPPTTSESKTV